MSRMVQPCRWEKKSLAGGRSVNKKPVGHGRVYVFTRDAILHSYFPWLPLTRDVQCVQQQCR
jgi:hypothetical protein